MIFVIFSSDRSSESPPICLWVGLSICDICKFFTQKQKIIQSCCLLLYIYMLQTKNKHFKSNWSLILAFVSASYQNGWYLSYHHPLSPGPPLFYPLLPWTSRGHPLGPWPLSQRENGTTATIYSLLKAEVKHEIKLNIKTIVLLDPSIYQKSFQLNWWYTNYDQT